MPRKEKSRTLRVDDLYSTDGTNNSVDSSGSAVKTVYTVMDCSASDLASFREWRLLHYIVHSADHSVSAVVLSPVLALWAQSGTTYRKR